MGSSTSIPIQSWFKHIAGCDESSFRGNMFVKDENGHLWINSYNAGRWNVSPVSELRKEAGASVKAEGGDQSHHVKLVFLTRRSAQGEQAVDVASLQAKPENAGAVFLVASNMNGIEGVSESVNIESSNFCTNYIHDRTQGPAASISAGAAAIARVYAGLEDGSRQTMSTQCNFLGHPSLSKHFPVENGYVVVPREVEMPEFPERHSEQWDELLDNAAVGVHRNAQVTFGHRSDGRFQLAPEGQYVHQVLAAAMNVGQGFSGRVNKRSAQASLKCQFVLDSVFRSCYYVCAATCASKLFLTPIGGGVFGNNHTDIFESIIDAHRTLAHQTLLNEVFVVLYSPTELTDELKSRLAESGVEYEWRLCDDPQVGRNS